MKKNLFLLAGLMLGLGGTQAQIIDTSGRWEKYLVVTKDKYTESGGAQNFIFDIDTLNPSKKIAFYGNWDKAYLYDKDGKSRLITDAPNAIFADGTSAGAIKFNPDYSYSTINNHIAYEGEYIGVFKSDSHAIAHSPIMYLKNNKFIPETSIKLSGESYIYPIGNNKFFLVGNYFYGWDKNGQKEFRGASVWDKNKGTLTALQSGIADPSQVNVSNKDGTIAVVTSSNYYNMLKIVWYGGEKFMDSLYPFYPHPTLPENGRINDVYVLDKHNMYAIWGAFEGGQHKILKLDFKNKKWITIATTNGLIAGITGDGGDRVFFCGSFTEINGKKATSKVMQYSISKGAFSDIRTLALNFGSARIFYVGSELFLVDGSNLLGKTETVYRYTRPDDPIPPAFVLASFSAKTQGMKNVLSWNTSSENGSDRFEIERSADGKAFVKIATVNASVNSNSTKNYSYSDNSPLGGDNHYRLKLVAKDGKSSYSSVVKVVYTPPIIELAQFSGKMWGGDNNLNWTTSKETESDRFEIERSSGGKTFAKIGTISASGNSTSTKSYSYTDSTPPYSKNSYRLKMITKDGKSSYSSVVVIDNSITQPVLLLDFTGAVVNDKNVLSWMTSQEINSDRFEIERSADSFQYFYIGEVKSHGNSSVEREYSFDDHSPLPTNFYRLKMVDIDGQFEYSSVVKLENEKEKEGFSVYPNPVVGDLIANLPSDRGYLSVVNISGQVIDRQEIKTSMTTLKTDTWPKGVYGIIFQFRDENRRSTLKVVKH